MKPRGTKTWSWSALAGAGSLLVWTAFVGCQPTHAAAASVYVENSP